MSIAQELQNIVSDLSVSIAGAKKLGRVEQERLRTRLANAATQLRRDDAAGTVSRLILDDLICSVERGVGDIAGAAQHARMRAASPAASSANG